MIQPQGLLRNSVSGVFGDGSDGDVTISANTSLASTEDGDVVVRQYNTLTVDAGATLTVDNRCRGLFIFVKGDCTINGAISMSARGCHANPADSATSSNTPIAPSDGNAVPTEGIVLRFRQSGGSSSHSAADIGNGLGLSAKAVLRRFPSVNNGYVLYIPRVGGLGAAGARYSGQTGGTHASAPGGGGNGGGFPAAAVGKVSGSGGNATCFSGGPGGGGISGDASTQNDGFPGDNYGGAGGNASQASPTPEAWGGAGNPAGLDGPSCPSHISGAEDGTGGLLLIVVGGDVLGSGHLESVGSQGGPSLYNGPLDGGGGGSGGGLIAVVHAGTLSGSITSDVSGGLPGQFPNNQDRQGGAGGDGQIITQQIDPA